MRTGNAFTLTFGLIFTCWPRLALADRPPDKGEGGDPPARWLAGASVNADLGGAGVALDGRYRFASDVQLGLFVGGDLPGRAYLSGRPVDGVAGASAGLILLLPLVSSPRVKLFFRSFHGANALSELGGAARATRQTNDLGAFAHVRMTDKWLLRTGVRAGFELEVDPLIELADQTQLLTLGCGYSLAKGYLLYAEATTGGTFGFNGDNAKLIAEGLFGVRFSLPGGDDHGAF